MSYRKSKIFSLLNGFLVFVIFQNCNQNSFQATVPAGLDLPSETQGEEFENAFDSDFGQAASLPDSEIQVLATLPGKTYYVSKSGSDTNGLTKATAFRTIQKAATAAKAGDTVVVLAGVYKEHVRNKNHGKPTARIRFVSSPRWAAKIAPTTGAAAFWTSTGSHVDIEGFTFDGKLGGEVPVFRVRALQVDGNASRVMYNNIRLYRACTPELFYRTGVGIGIGGYESNFNTEVVGNVVRNTRVVGCSLPPRIDKDSNGTYHYEETAGYGIYHATPKGKVYNNIIFGFRIGIHLWHNPTDSIVSHNLMFNNGNRRVGYQGVGIIFGCGSAPHTTCKNIIVSNNILMHNYGTYSIREYGTNVKGSNQVNNNIRYMNASDAIVDDDKPKIIGVSGNLVGLNPKLVNFQLNGTGDYRLSSGSPGTNGGSTLGAVAKDINQGTRSGKPDIGPYEFGAAAPFPINVSAANKALTN